MQKIYKKGIPAFQFHLFQKFSDDFDHAIFSRLGGVSKAPYDSLNLSFHVQDNTKNVRKNRELIRVSCGLEKGFLVDSFLVHGKKIAILDEEMLRNEHVPLIDANSELYGVDALISAGSGIGLMMKVADCQAILMYDPVQKVVANVHAGWRGLAQDISGVTINVMRKKFGSHPRNIIVGISPSLGSCCAFFSEPEKELPPWFRPYIHEREGNSWFPPRKPPSELLSRKKASASVKFSDSGTHETQVGKFASFGSSLFPGRSCKTVDLWQASFNQLRSHGILSEHIELARVCTFCGGDGLHKGASASNANSKFYSFRRDKGMTGRFGVVIWKK